MSSYFPHETHAPRYDSKPKKIVPVSGPTSSTPINSTNGNVHFPLHRAVLWDRSTLQTQSKVTIYPDKVLPSLLLPTESIREILTRIAQTHIFEQYGHIYSATSLFTDDKLASLMAQPLSRVSKSSYLLYAADDPSFKSTAKTDKTLYFTIPYTNDERASRSNKDQPSTGYGAESESANSLLVNLKKSIKMNTEFALKSLLRIRCTTSTSNNPSFLHATLRLYSPYSISSITHLIIYANLMLIDMKLTYPIFLLSSRH
jgi:hypothetical protein